MDKPFIIQSMYCSHTDKSFLYQTMEFVVTLEGLATILTYISLCAIFYDDHCEPHGYSHKEGIHDHLQSVPLHEIFNIQRLYKGRT